MRVEKPAGLLGQVFSVVLILLTTISMISMISSDGAGEGNGQQGSVASEGLQGEGLDRVG